MQLPQPLLRRNANTHKNNYGHVLIVAGSDSMLGAAALASLSAMRSGAGLVTCAIPKHLNLTLHKKLSSVVMTLPLPKGNEFKKIQSNFKKYDAIAIGPGMGQEPAVRKLIHKIIEASPKPLIIDADALNALSLKPEILLKMKVPKILTPHPGEMSRLIGKSRAYVEANRLKTAQDFANKYNCILLLKGHRTVVAAPNLKPYINKTGNSGMATAGSGDVLTGMIAAFVAQGIDPYKAACLGAFLHGKAGDRAAIKLSKAGMIANDIIDSIPFLLN